MLNEKFKAAHSKMRAKGNLHGKDGRNGDWSSCWKYGKRNLLTVLCLHLLIPPFLMFVVVFFFYPRSLDLRRPVRHHLSLASQTHCKTEQGRCWWHHSGGCKVMMEWWPVCVWLCVHVGLCKCSGSRACQRATVTPLLLHRSQFTTKHPHRSVWGYLWGDCKMSMDFRPHCTNLKTRSGTFRTTNGFRWYMTSALSCFFFSSLFLF